MADTTELFIQDNGEDISAEIARLSDGWDVDGEIIEVCMPYGITYILFWSK